MSGLALLVYRTPLGTAMRATAQNPQVAGLMGIDTNRVIASTFVIGAALGAGYIGDFTDLCQYGVFAGTLEACKDGGHFVLAGSNYQDVFSFFVLILVLVFRPSGLLGERVGDRA